MKRIGALLAAAAVVLVASGCEPAMIISASVSDQTPGLITCPEQLRIIGKVAPATATPKVVLQRTVGGKWVDVTGWGSFEQQASGADKTLRTAHVNQSTGSYSIPWMVDTLTTQHFRVRSNKSGATSKSFYVEVDGWDGPCG